MGSSLKIGRALFAVSLLGFGVQYVLYAIGAKGPAVGPPWYPSSVAVGWLAAIGLIGVAVCLFVPRLARLAAGLLGWALALRVLLGGIPWLVRQPHNPSPWTVTFEILSLCAGADVLAGLLAPGVDTNPGWSRMVALNARLGPYLLGLSLVIFAIQHFMFAAFVAALIPAWIPARVFFAYFAGVAFIAAAAAMMTKVLARLAALLLGVMFATWVVILHAPRVAHVPANGNELTSLFMALAMSGIGFILAARFEDDRAGRSS